MHFLRKGSGKPLLLIHGLGGSSRSWSTIIDGLAAEREVIAVDLPGFGETPALKGEVSMRTLADALSIFLRENNLSGVDAVGSSMGARLVLGLVRRGGLLGAVVSLDPGGFWKGWERHFFYSSVWLSIRLVRLLQGVMPRLVSSPVGRSVLFRQFSPRPARLPAPALLTEMRDYVRARSFDTLLYNLAYGEEQKGILPGTLLKPLVIGWGRNDLICLPGQSKRAQALFPDARIYWFERSGHFPHWDVPGETIRLILQVTGD